MVPRGNRDMTGSPFGTVHLFGSVAEFGGPGPATCAALTSSSSARACRTVVAVGALGARRRDRDRHRVLRHRYAGDSAERLAGGSRLSRRRELVRRYRLVSLLHRRAGAEPARECATDRTRRAGSVCASTRTTPCPIRPGARAGRLGYLGTYSEDRQPTLDGLLCEPARRWPRSPLRGCRPALPRGFAMAAPMSSASSMSRPDSIRGFTAGSDSPSMLPARDMVRRRFFAKRAAVRGGGMRRADHQRLVAGSRQPSSSPAVKS